MHNGHYHETPCSIRESSVHPTMLIVHLDADIDHLGYAEGSEFYVALDSISVHQGFLTVDNPGSILTRHGVGVTGRVLGGNFYEPANQRGL